MIEQEKIIQQWILDFDRLHRDQKQSTSGIKFIKHNNEMVDINKFLELKIEEASIDLWKGGAKYVTDNLSK